MQTISKHRLLVYATALVAAIMILSIIIPVKSYAYSQNVQNDTCDSCSGDQSIYQPTASPEESEEAVSLAKSHLDRVGIAYDKDRFVVQGPFEGKAWVLIPDNSSRDVVFHRVAVDLEADTVAGAQTYVISGSENAAGEHEAWVLFDKEELWHGTVDADGNITTYNDSEIDPSEQEYGGCEWAMGILCGTGGGAGCYGICLALGLVEKLSGLACATACSLIASIGCIAATNKICG
ncbi:MULTISPECIES: halocin C8-like domain-containing protein [unclassified Corynebacterium]|uniref:halocin C8-like domain-containing protein n=1 Tax=unclassified Corynebacterium TaxID=2624378 RepID=UPI0029C9B3C3|nr:MULTISPECIES: halocin C8-like domain-containing protein [unclassified Corynebacterium]WPF66690.1 halocin C8-like domain-containing protein [Corynebacterium sp. 22KM0430]WPF69177.1 halocin C8-like domain-containing protein [Corynebacterium sp. 21KM1197]